MSDADIGYFKYGCRSCPTEAMRLESQVVWKENAKLRALAKELRDALQEVRDPHGCTCAGCVKDLETIDKALAHYEQVMEKR